METIKEQQLKEGEIVEIYKIDDRPQLVVNHQVTFFSDDQEVHAVQHSSLDRIDSREQSYKRRMKAIDKWSLLDYGWIDDPSFIVITNNEKDSQHILQIAFGPKNEAVLTINPDSCQVLNPLHPDSVYIRSIVPLSSYTIHAFPR